jgi:hypothetical protein
VTGDGRRFTRRAWVDRNRPRVLDVAPGLIHESGPAHDRSWAPERAAIMAHWSTDPVPSRSVVAILHALDSEGYQTLLVSAADVLGLVGRTCTWAPGQPRLPETTTVLRRANVGYDFGSWAAVLDAFPGVRRAARVVLVNDSLIGPLASLAPVLSDFEGGRDPVWGLSGSGQYRPHMQSFFTGYRDGILDHPALRAFWSGIRVESRKAKTVRYDELGLSEVVETAGIRWRTQFEPHPGGSPNPTIGEWERLLDAGFPFIKRAALRQLNSDGSPPVEGGRAVGRSHVIDLAEWDPEMVRITPAPPGSDLLNRARERLDIRGVSPRGRNRLR